MEGVVLVVFLFDDLRGGGPCPQISSQVSHVGQLPPGVTVDDCGASGSVSGRQRWPGCLLLTRGSGVMSGIRQNHPPRPSCPGPDGRGCGQNQGRNVSSNQGLLAGLGGGWACRRRAIQEAARCRGVRLLLVTECYGNVQNAHESRVSPPAPVGAASHVLTWPSSTFPGPGRRGLGRSEADPRAWSSH